MASGVRPGAQPGGRVPAEHELRDGIRLSTGQEHRLAVPTGTLVITAPPEAVLLITHPPGAAGDHAPLMPLLEGFSARIVGLTPDPTPRTRFRWVFTLDYTTREQKPRATRVVYEAESVGGALPPDVLRTRAGRVTLGPGAPAAGGARGATVAAAGGTLRVAVHATINGVAKAARARATYSVLAADNPPKSAIAAALRALYSEVELGWMLRIACQETGRQQFRPHGSTRANAATRTHPGEPVMNQTGDGGVGMFQITNPKPGAAELWDWCANVRAIRHIWFEKRAWMTGYIGAVRATVLELARGAGSNPVTRMQAERRARGLPALLDIHVPDLSPEYMLESVVRGFNGFAGHSRIVPRKGLPEFDVMMTGEAATRRTVVDVPRDGVVGTLQWERVPVVQRPRSGDPNYVEHVRTARCTDD